MEPGKLSCSWESLSAQFANLLLTVVQPVLSVLHDAKGSVTLHVPRAICTHEAQILNVVWWVGCFRQKRAEALVFNFNFQMCKNFILWTNKMMKVPLVFEKKVLIWGVCSHRGGVQTLFENGKRNVLSFWTLHTPKREELRGWLVLEAGMSFQSQQQWWAIAKALGRDAGPGQTPGWTTRYPGGSVPFQVCSWVRSCWVRRPDTGTLLDLVYEEVCWCRPSLYLISKNKTCSGCLLKLFKIRMGQGIRLLLMLQCYKLNGKTDT